MLTVQEYVHWRKIADAYRGWSDSLGRNWYTPDEVPEELRSLTNKIRSQIEIYEWMTSPPEEYMAYVDEKDNRITTWMGDELGVYRVTGTHWETVEVGYLDENEEECIEHEQQRVKDLYVIGSNGKTYYGKHYYQDGDYCTMMQYEEGFEDD